MKIKLRKRVRKAQETAVVMKRKSGLPTLIWSVMMVTTLLLVVSSHTEIQQFIKLEFEAKTLFRSRSWLVPERLHPTIKVFSYDDRVVAQLKTFDPPIRYWSKIFSSLEKSGAATITIDKIFDSQKFAPRDVQEFQDTMSQLKIPVFNIGFIAPQPIPYRESWSSNWQPTVSYDEYPIGNFYGASASIVDSLQNIGHAVYDGKGYIWAVYQNERNQYMPHLSLRFADAVGGAKPPANKTFVNFLTKDAFADQTFSLLPVIGHAIKGETIPIVEPGDHVILLPAMYTGNTDFQSTPHGIMEGGLVLTSLINSSLQDTWLTDVNCTFVWVCAFFFLGFVAQRSSLLRTFAAGAIFLTTYLVGAHLCFIFGDLVLPYAIPSMAFLLSLFGKAAIRIQENTLNEVRMENELQTAMLVQASFTQHEEQSAVPIASYYRSMEECCGDWWGHKTTKNNIEIVFLADATGHGAPAALVTAMVFSAFHSALKTCPEEAVDIPVYINNHLNDILWQTKQSGKQTATSLTGIIMAVEPAKEKLHFCNAGHIPPLYLSKEKAKTVMSRGNPIGLLEDSENKVLTIDFPRGDRVLIMTDGVFERENLAGRQLRRQQVQKVIAEMRNESSDKIIEKTIGYVDEFSKGTPSTDDVTMLIIG